MQAAANESRRNFDALLARVEGRRSPDALTPGWEDVNLLPLFIMFELTIDMIYFITHACQSIIVKLAIGLWTVQNLSLGATFILKPLVWLSPLSASALTLTEL